MGSDEVLLLVLRQVWQVAMIAVAVWILTKTFVKNQPQMAHLLWGLVLIKVITPPIWSSPTGVFSWLVHNTTQPNYSTAAWEPTGPRQGSITSSLTVDLRKQTESAGIRSSFTGMRQAGDALSADENAVSTFSAGPHWAIGSLLTIWLVGVGFLMVASVIRFVAFWCWVRGRVSGECDNLNHKRRLQLEGQLQDCTLMTAAKLGVHRRVQVHLIDAPIGPAVIGLFRPAMILPLRIVEDRPVEFLEPLIAHELVHIRRGDLFWALLQSLSTSLLWFHPLVWLASRRLTLESERSCDEQTIAWLGCSPAAYARSLIDVLERKHQLRVAPVLPGVRPVDVTRNRLERIMKLGQGSRKRTPIWAWATFLVAVTLVLPGAAFIGAQENADFSRPLNRSADATKLSPDSQLLAVEAIPIGEAEVEIGDLLERLEASGESEEQARNILLSFLPHRLRQPIYRVDQDGEISESTNARIDGTSLHFVGTPEQIANVKDAIQQRRRFGFRQTAIHVRFLTMSKARMDQLNIPWRKAAPLPDGQFDADQFKEEALVSSHSTAILEIESTAETPRQNVFRFEDGTKVTQPATTPAGSDFAPSKASEPPNTHRRISFDAPSATELQVPAIPMPAFYAIVANEALIDLLVIAQSDSRTNVLQAPRVTAFNGTTIHINDTVQRPFVTEVTPINGELGTVMSPTIEIAVEGVKILALPIVDDDRTVELLFALNERRIAQVETFTYDKSIALDPDGNPVKSGTTVQIPQLVSRFLVLKSNLKLDESLFVTSGIPTLDAASKGSDEVMMIAIATASDVWDMERHEERQTMTDANVPAMKSTAAPRYPEQTEPSHERYERIPVAGPITTGGPARALDPPTDSEILQVLQKLREQRSGFLEPDWNQPANARIVKEKIADYVDPPRFVPMIGRAQLHHAHYKCSVYSTERAANRSHEVEKPAEALRLETVYLDHNHFHVVKDPTK